jgi:hypothetical protein
MVPSLAPHPVGSLAEKKSPLYVEAGQPDWVLTKARTARARAKNLSADELEAWESSRTVALD